MSTHKYLKNFLSYLPWPRWAIQQYPSPKVTKANTATGACDDILCQSLPCVLKMCKYDFASHDLLEVIIYVGYITNFISSFGTTPVAVVAKLF